MRPGLRSDLASNPGEPASVAPVYGTTPIPKGLVLRGVVQIAESNDSPSNIILDLAEVANLVDEEGGDTEDEHLAQHVDRVKTDLNSHQAPEFTKRELHGPPLSKLIPTRHWAEW